MSRHDQKRGQGGRFPIRLGAFRVAALVLVAGLDQARAENTGGDPASLERLHDVVSLPPVSWWPLAPGWYGLAFVVTVSALTLLWQTRRRSVRDRYRHEALAELARLRAESLPVAAAVADRMVLLKRTALSAYPRAEVASLYGSDWWRYLDEHVDQALFAPDLGAECEALAYRDRDSDESEEATRRFERFDHAVERWIREHHRGHRQQTASADVATTDRGEAMGAA